MSILHRVYARHAAAVWEVETRLIHRLGLVRPPTAVQWMATRACDLTCAHCYSHAGPRADGELTTDEARGLLDELVALGRPALVLAGGEPLLRPDLPELIREAAGRGIQWSMHTHGRLVPRHRALFEEHPPAMVAVSIDGPEEHHDRFRGRAGSYRDALAAVAVLRETGCEEVIAGTTVTRQNADLVADMLPEIMASGVHGWGLHLFAPEGRGAEQMGLFPTADQLRRVAAFARRARSLFPVELDNEWGSAGTDDPYYRDSPFLCGAGRITCVVTATGEVMPCTTTDLAESAGNIRDRPLSQLWREGFARFRRPGNPTCADGRECWLQARNGNACRKLAFGREEAA